MYIHFWLENTYISGIPSKNTPPWQKYPPLVRDPGRSRYPDFGSYVFCSILPPAENFSWISKTLVFKGETAQNDVHFENFRACGGLKTSCNYDLAKPVYKYPL